MKYLLKLSATLAVMTALTAVSASASFGDIIRVKWDSPGPIFDGSSWDYAYHTVSEGLNAADSGDEVWVARGTYVENITLEVGVGLYGGFDGTETSWDERDWTTNITILDGNQAGSVVTAPTGATSTTVIDGFTIRNGSGTLNTYGDYCGGGVYCVDSSPTISNNKITGNTPELGGGAVYCELSSATVSNNTIVGNRCVSGAAVCCIYSSDTVTGNTIVDNGVSGSGAGGAIYCYQAPVTISNNTFIGNWALGLGGVLFSYDSAVTVVNNVIAGNSASDGGGIYCWEGSPTIANNTLMGNSAWRGGGIYCDSASPAISNNIIAFGSSGVYKTGGSPTFSHNDVYGNSEYNYSGVTDPTGTNGNISVDPLLADMSYGNLHIQPTSPCRDAGDNSVVQPGWLDIDGQARIQPESGTVDIGADESDGTEWPPVTPIIVRVSPTGDDTNDGSSWTLAKKTVQAGIGAAAAEGGEVWVKAGTYNEHLALAPFTYMYGGFNGTEADKSERNWETNITTLDGTENGIVVRVLGGYAFSAVDGFTITHGYANRGAGIYCWASSPMIANNTIADNVALGMDDGYGAAIYCYYYAAPTITGNTITGNDACYGGGGIYCCRNSAPTIADNTFTGNVASAGSGGAVFCAQDSSPTISGNVIEQNSAEFYGEGGGDGGGIFCAYCSPPITGNKITGNTASARGGGIHCSYSSPAITGNVFSGNTGHGGAINCYYSDAMIANNTISSNHAPTRGGGIDVDPGSSPTIINNTIWDNSAGERGGGIHCLGDSPVITNNIIAFNTSAYGIYWSSGTPILSYNDVYGNSPSDYYGISPGTGDISSDPQFVDQANDDVHLLGTSPCVDAGTNTGAPDTDMEGYSRPYDGNGDGNAICDMGAYEYQPTWLALAISTYPDGTKIAFGPVTVTAIFTAQGWVYVERIDRIAGIRVATSESLTQSQLVHVFGTIQTDTSNGERYIQSTTGWPKPAAGTFAAGSLGMRNEWLGGEPPSVLVPTLKDAFGFYNVGLLVQSWGEVTFVDPGGEYFYINDGSDLVDGSGKRGVRVIVPSGVSTPSVDDYVKVTGASSAIAVQSNYVRVLRVRSQSDIVIVTSWDDSGITLARGWNQLGLPGIPKDPDPEEVFVGCAYGIPLDGRLKRYDALNQRWRTYMHCGSMLYGIGNCLIAEGYSLYISLPPWLTACYYYERTPVPGDQLVSLPRGSDPIDYFSFIGNPFDYSRAWSSCMVTDGNSVVSLPDAVSQGWIHKAEYWDGSAWQEVTDLATGDMDARKGYLIYPSVDNLAMIVPE